MFINVVSGDHTIVSANDPKPDDEDNPAARDFRRVHPGGIAIEMLLQSPPRRCDFLRACPDGITIGWLMGTQ